MRLRIACTSSSFKRATSSHLIYTLHIPGLTALVNSFINEVFPDHDFHTIKQKSPFERSKSNSWNMICCPGYHRVRLSI